MDRFSGTGFVTVGGHRQFIDLNIATGAGSYPNALWFNGSQESIIGIVEAAGLTPTDADNTQLLQAITALANARVAAQPHGAQVFTASGSFTVPAAVYALEYEVVGGGGGGGSATYGGAGAAGGGGAGGRSKGVVAVTPGQTIAVTIGAGGAGSIGTAPGGGGGTSSFGSIASCTGGGGGSSVTSTIAANGGAPGGIGSGGTANGTGAPGTNGQYNPGSFFSGIGGSSPWGGGGGESAGAAIAASGFGAGGGGGANGYAGAAASAGLIYLKW